MRRKSNPNITAKTSQSGAAHSSQGGHNGTTVLKPFKLTIFVHEAVNLPIADITQSDPFVLLTLGEKPILKTNTVYRNHSNPRWDKRSVENLLHINDKLLVEVFDEKQSGDRLLCKAIIDLTQFEYNVEKDNRVTLLDNSGKNAGFLYLTIMKVKFTTYISMNPISRVDEYDNPSIISDDDALESKNVVGSKTFLRTWLRKSLSDRKIVDDTHDDSPMEAALLNSPLLSYRSGPRIATDIMDDVANILSFKVESSTSNFCTRIPRVCSSTLLDLDTLLTRPFVPFKRVGLVMLPKRVEDNIACSRPICLAVYLSFPNRQTLWIWTKWIRLAMRYWRNEISIEDIPEWAEANGRQIAHTKIRVFIGHKHNKKKGRLILSLDQSKFTLQLREKESNILIESIDLDNFSSIQITQDTPVAQACRLQFENLSVNIGSTIANIDDMSLIIRGHPTYLLSHVPSSSGSTKSIYFDCDGFPYVDIPSHDTALLYNNATDADDFLNRDGFHIFLCSTPAQPSVGSNVLDAATAAVNQIPGHKVILPTIPENNLNSIHVDPRGQLLKACSIPLLAHRFVSFREIFTSSPEATAEFMRMNEVREGRGHHFHVKLDVPSASKHTEIVIKLKRASLTWEKSSAFAQKPNLNLKFMFRCVTADWRGKHNKLLPAISTINFSGDAADLRDYEIRIPFSTLWTDVEFLKLKMYSIGGLSMGFLKSRCGTLLIPLKDIFHSSLTPTVTPRLMTYKLQNDITVIPKNSGGLNTPVSGSFEVLLCGVQDPSKEVLKIDLNLRMVGNALNIQPWPAEAFLVATLLKLGKVKNKSDQLQTNESEQESTDRRPIENCSVVFGVAGLSIELHSVGEEQEDEDDTDLGDEDDDGDDANTSGNGEGVEVEPAFDNNSSLEIDTRRSRSKSAASIHGNRSSKNKNLRSGKQPIHGIPELSNSPRKKSHSSHHHHSKNTNNIYTSIDSLSQGRPAVNSHRSQKEQNAHRKSFFLSGCCTGDSSVDAVVGGTAQQKSIKDFNPISPDTLARLALYDRHVDAVLTTCSERTSTSNTSFVIPWANVASHDLITESVMSITVRVGRFFGLDRVTNVEVYHPALVEILVSNCPAKHICALIDDRINFTEYRSQIQSLSLGNTDPIDIVNSLDSDAKLIEEYIIMYTGSMKNEKGILTASSSVRAIDPDSMLFLHARACRLRLYIALLIHLSSFADDANSGLALTSPVYYNRNKGKPRIDWSRKAEEVVTEDFAHAKTIKVEGGTAVDTINSQVEWLLAQARSHLIQAGLEGWNERKGPLLKYFETILNEFLIELTSLFSKLFESQQGIKTFKGLTSKTKLILTFAKHNDDLENLFKKGPLITYALQPTPSAQLLLYLDFNSWLSLYVTTLHAEMSTVVPDVYAYWSDPTKDASGQRNHYKSKLPWLPMRSAGLKGLFLTQMPEDIRNRLKLYLKDARLQRDVIAESLRSNLRVLNEKLLIAVWETFLRLSEYYWKAVTNQTGWLEDKEMVNLSITTTLLGSRVQSVTKPVESLDSKVNDLQERAEWYCSVINDSSRTIRKVLNFGNIHDKNSKDLGSKDAIDSKAIAKKSYHTLQDVDDDDDSDESIKMREDIEEASQSFVVAGVMDQVYTSFAAVIERGVEKLSALAFRISFFDNAEWLDPYVHRKWLPSAETDVEAARSAFVICFNDLIDWLDSVREFLEPVNFYKLVSSCLDRTVLRYLHMLRIADESGRTVSSSGLEIQAIEAQINEIKLRFFAVLEASVDTKPLSDTLRETQFMRMIGRVASMLREPLNSNEINESIKKWLQWSQGHPCDAESLASFGTTLMSLRQDTGGYFSRIKRSKQQHLSLTGETSVYGSTHGNTVPVPSFVVQDMVTQLNYGTNNANVPAVDSLQSMSTDSNASITGTVAGSRAGLPKKRKSITDRAYSILGLRSSATGLSDDEREQCRRIKEQFAEIRSYADTTTKATLFSTIFSLNSRHTAQWELDVLMREDVDDRNATERNALDAINSERFAGTEKIEQSHVLRISDLAISPIDTSRKMNYKLRILTGQSITTTIEESIGEVIRLTDIGLTDINSKHYVWLDEIVDFQLNNLQLNRRPLNIELLKIGKVYGSTLLGYYQIPLTSLLISDMDGDKFKLHPIKTTSNFGVNSKSKQNESSTDMMDGKLNEVANLPQLTISIRIINSLEDEFK